MDRFIQTIFLILLPFYPFWAWIFYSYTKKPASMFVVLMLIPLVLYTLINKRIKIPAYLIFLILFTIYHLASVLMNHLIPPGTNKVFFLLSDFNVFACLVFIVVESTTFDETFIKKMTRLIFVTVIITTIVSIIQIKDPTFFISPEMTGNVEGLAFLMANRNFSIFSWVNLNSIGISFPILISILLSLSHTKKRIVPISIVSGILVSFLSRSRYVMISIVIAISQMFINAKIALRRKIYMFLLLVSLVFMLIGIASVSGFDIQQVIDTRILEKGSDMESAKARILSYEVFMIKFPEYPWFGVGPSTRDDVLRMLDGVPIIHVGYLSYLYYYGIVGCLLLFICLFFLLRYAWIIAKKHAFWGSFYGLFTFCFANVTFVYFNLSEMGVVLAVIYLKYYSDKSNELLQQNTA